MQAVRAIWREGAAAFYSVQYKRWGTGQIVIFCFFRALLYFISQIPFPEELPVNRDTILQFCADFISGKLKYNVFVYFLLRNPMS